MSCLGSLAGKIAIEPEASDLWLLQVGFVSFLTLLSVGYVTTILQSLFVV